MQQVIFLTVLLHYDGFLALVTNFPAWANFLTIALFVFFFCVLSNLERSVFSIFDSLRNAF